MLLGIGLTRCGVTERSDGGKASHGGAGSADGKAGGSGAATLLLPPDDPPIMQREYPPQFGANDCPGGPPPTLGGAEQCVTLEQLLDDQPRLSVIGGFGILGTEAHWRCPTIEELMADSGCSLGEGCCIADAYCGPMERPKVDGLDQAPDGAGGASGGSGGTPGVAGASERDDHRCCYYIVTVCGV